MNKKLTILSLIFGLFVCATIFCACSKSDDDNSSGGNSGSSKHIVKTITEEGGSIYESTPTYDSQGRVTKVIGTESGTNGFFRSEMTYQYGETLIITKAVEEGTLSNGQSESWSETHAYTLENGRIVKDEEKQGSQIDGRQWHYSSTTETFSYDVNNYLSSISSKGSDNESETKIIKWSNGNLIKLGERSFEYSNYPWVKGFPFYLKGSNMDNNLFAIGYYGNIPKNLPSKYYASETSGFTYEYSFEGGYVTKVVTTPFVETNKIQKSISTIIWE
jgi:hypothetical protein